MPLAAAAHLASYLHGEGRAEIRESAAGCTRELTDRFREAFRVPTGVRKSPKNEPAGHVRCAMGFLRSGWSNG